MKNILFISFVFLFFVTCDDNPVTNDDPVIECSSSGCTADGCAADCACGCDGAGGADCTCSAGCACGTDDDTGTTWNSWYGTTSDHTISVGDIVLWTSTGQHTVTSDDGVSFDSGTLSSGGTFQHQFDTAGQFSYHCNFHESTMTGTITVE